MRCQSVDRASIKVVFLSKLSFFCLPHEFSVQDVKRATPLLLQFPVPCWPERSHGNHSSTALALESIVMIGFSKRVLFTLRWIFIKICPTV